MTPYQRQIMESLSHQPDELLVRMQRILIIRSVPTPQIDDLTAALSKVMPKATFTILSTDPVSDGNHATIYRHYPYGRYFNKKQTPASWYRQIRKEAAPDFVVLPMAGNNTTVGYENVLSFIHPWGDLRCMYVYGNGDVSLKTCAQAGMQGDGHGGHSRPEKVESLPHSVTMNLTEACNLRCVMCDSRVAGKPASMDFDLFLSAAAQMLPNCRHLTLNGFMGEPLCHPLFKEILEHIDDDWPDISILFATNATLLSDDIATGIVQSKVVREIRFSLNASSAATYERMMPPARFDRVVGQIKSFMEKIKEADRGNDIDTSLSFVATRDNIAEMPSMIPLAASMGVAQVMIWDLMISRHENRTHLLKGRPDKAQSVVTGILQDAQARAQVYDVRLQLPPSLLQNGQKQSDRETGNLPVDCTFPWTHTYLSPNGEIVPCCFYNRPMGHLTESSFKQIWNGPAYRRFRRQIMAGKIPLPCRNCTQNAAADLKKPHYVQH